MFKLRSESCGKADESLSGSPDSVSAHGNHSHGLANHFQASCLLGGHASRLKSCALRGGGISPPSRAGRPISEVADGWRVRERWFVVVNLTNADRGTVLYGLTTESAPPGMRVDFDPPVNTLMVVEVTTTKRRE